MNGRNEIAASSISDLSASPQLMGVERGVGGRSLNGGALGGAAAGAADAPPPPHPPSPDGSEPPRKRPRPTRPDDAPALRRAILDCHVLRLKALRDRFTEQLSELYFLQAGGNMMDYSAWRRRPATPQLVSYLEARRPPPAADSTTTAPSAVSAAAPAPASVPVPTLLPVSVITVAAAAASTPLMTSAPVHAPVQAAAPAPAPVPAPAPALAPVPVLAPINVPLAAAAAPVSTPTPTPAATATFTSTPAAAPVATPTLTVVPSPAPAPVPAPTPAPPPSTAPADEMVEKAKQEAYVARRVSELSRAGLWTERRLPRVLEPPRSKSHWDYLLEEMAWLAQDFAHERKWKKQAARKCARAVQKYFQDKALAAQRAEKAQETQLKKIASFAAKEVRTFWSNVEKLVEWKRVRRVERARKEALDEQLSYIVDRTERYSRQLAANMAPATIAPATPAIPATPASDDEFTPRGCSDDDEETIAAAEREAGLDAAAHKDEIEALRRESRLDLGDLLPPGYLPAHSPPPSDYSPDDGDDSADDERTIDEQERAETGRDHDHAAELDALRHDAHLDIDELIRRYAAREPPPQHTAHSDSDTDAVTTSTASTGHDSDTDIDSDVSDSPEEPLEALIQDTQTEGGETNAAPVTTVAPEAGESERRVEQASSLAASLQPTGTTLSETAVGTPVPRLLRHALREYQHVGLHWLATMHARGLNGILADEMGLGKTVQTIALLAHLALERLDWGPHLVVAPTSVVLNWEMEFKKWCPAFKILTYYGTIKERKQKRVGWTKANSFHVCITSYKLVVQDHQSFRRKKWKYLILDEAQNIKNFKSQRWQLLLNFQTERRLLLTGTPLQNSLVELWSLMHFLMPEEFASHSEFREWFAEVGAMAEGARYAEEPLRRLHAVLRPFLLRRLKRDVERQMPRKYERVLMCRLAARQRCLYDDFMSRAKTKESLASGNLLSVINVLMQLRKVCNHPDLFESRPVTSPLHLGALRLHSPALLILTEVRGRVELAARLGGDLAALETADAGAFAAHRARHLAPPRRALEDAADAHRRPPPRPPPAPLRLHLRLVPRAAPAATAPPAPAVALAAAPHTQRVPPVPAPRPAGAAGAGGGSTASSTSAARLQARRRAALRRLATCNERRCWRLPLYGADLRAAVHTGPPPVPPRDIADLLTEMHDIIDRFSICWSPARAATPLLWAGAGGGAREWRRQVARVEEAAAAGAARAALALLHAPASRQAVAFPHPSLLQYDCGKLQTLAVLLRRLKAGAHRVLIFTQMTRVLDVLEAFLSMHGHAYLRLDGATRVDRRQTLVDRFNADPRIFAFILSTRSGGVGLNLTGADSVVFYDSDWNPTMDAQAQDRCHRIGQTRDVHVYRLVTAATVEENILRKAEQKRALGHLAIEDGHFTTSYLRGANIKELFGAETAVPEGGGAGGGGGGELESALAAAEDEADAAAARAARAEAQGDLAEFDESVPLDDEPRLLDTQDPHHPHHPQDPHAAELAALMSQLTPIEKYAMRVVESGEAACEAERTALGEMKRQLREWEEARRQLRRASPSNPRAPATPARSPSPPLTYCRGSRAEVWVNAAGDRMPMWCPPTPPAGDGDVYCDTWSRALYRSGAAAEALLPPVTRREPRAVRDQRRPRVALRAAHAVGVGAAGAPPSLFDRGGPRPRPRPRVSHVPAAAHVPQPEWSGAEDAALRRALRLQRVPPDPPPAIAPNWEWVAELVGEAARAYRSARACRDRHDALADPERARRRHRRPPAARRRLDDERPRPPLHRLDAVRDATERRRSAPKRRVDDPPHRNPKHAQLLADHAIDYDVPPTPVEVAARRADRIAREKLKAAAPQVPATISTVSAAPAASAAPPPTPVSAPQRVLVAAHGTCVKPDARRVRPAPAAIPATSSSASAPAPSSSSESPRVTLSGSAPTAQLLYRQQAFTARHLKILHQTVAPPTQGGAAGTSADGGATMRKLQIQQLAHLRRGPAGVVPASHAAHVTHVSHPSHVVVAHITAPPSATPPATPHTPGSPAPRHPDTRQ